MSFFCRPLKRAPNLADDLNPQLEAGGYRSHAGFADDGFAHAVAEQLKPIE
jgi:hypothetical protein